MPVGVPMSSHCRRHRHGTAHALTSIVRFFAAEEDRKSTSKEWRFEKEVAPGVQCHSIAVEGTGLRKFRAQGMIPSPPDVVAPLLWDPSTRLGWDTSYGDDQQIQVYASPNPGKDEIEVHRLCIKAVLVVSQRDFINLTVRWYLSIPSHGPGCHAHRMWATTAFVRSTSRMAHGF